MRKTVKIFMAAVAAAFLLAGCSDKVSMPGGADLAGGKPVKKEVRYEGNETAETKYAYDKKGLLIKEEYSYTYDGGNRTIITEYTYDADGKILSEVSTEAGYSSVRNYLYDELGRLVEINSGEDGQDSRLTREYDEYGNVICESMWFFGKEAETSYYEYYETGTIKKIENYKKNGTTLKDELNFVEEYDESGKTIFRVEYVQENREPVQDVKFIYEYSVEDNTVITTIYDADDNITETKVRMLNVEFPEYDEDGKMTSVKKYYGKTTEPEADFYYLYTYEYDKEGNKIKEICYSYYHDDNGKVRYSKEYYY